MPPAVQKPRSKAIFVRVQSAINNRRTKAVIANAGDFAAAYRACETVANVVWVTNQRARIGVDERQSDALVKDVLSFIEAIRRKARTRFESIDFG